MWPSDRLAAQHVLEMFRRALPKGHDKLSYLVAFNEIQHQTYNFMRHSSAEGDWKIEDFLEGLRQRAAASGVDVEGYFGAAVKSSLRSIS